MRGRERATHPVADTEGRQSAKARREEKVESPSRSVRVCREKRAKTRHTCCCSISTSHPSVFSSLSPHLFSHSPSPMMPLASPAKDRVVYRKLLSTITTRRATVALSQHVSLSVLLWMVVGVNRVFTALTHSCRIPRQGTKPKSVY